MLALWFVSGATRPVVEAAASSVQDDNGIIYTDSTMAEIKGYNSTVFNGTLLVPGTVTTIASNAFSYCRFIGDIYIPPNVKSIGSSAFSYIEGESVTIEGDGVTIGSGAFKYAYVYKFFLKGNAITASSYSSPFQNSNNLTLFEIKGANHNLRDGLTRSGKASSTRVVVDCQNSVFESLFEVCEAKEVEIRGHNLTFLGSYDIFERSTIGQVKIAVTELHMNSAVGKDVASLGPITFESTSFSELSANAFDSLDCSGTWTFADNFKKIQSRIFSYVNAIAGKVVIPEGVETIASDAFMGCAGITSFEITGTSVNFVEVDGVILDKDQTKVLLFPLGKSGSYELAENITSVDAKSFVRNALSELTVAAGNTAFAFDDGVLYNIDHTLVIACPGLKSSAALHLPATVTTIGPYAFSCCRGIKTVVFPQGLTTISEYAFESFEADDWHISLSSVTVQIYAFSRCSGLVSLHLSASVTNEYSFSYNGLTSISIEACKGVTKNVFANLTSLSSVTIQGSEVKLEEKGFFGCTSLANVVISGTKLTTSSMFRGCKIGNITFIGSDHVCRDLLDEATADVLSFSGCTNLRVTSALGDKPSDIGLILLENTSFDSVQRSAFRGFNCRGTISFVGSPTSLGNYIFADSHGIYGEVLFYGKLIDVDSTAFQNCPLITAFRQKSSITTWYSESDGIMYDTKTGEIALFPSGKTGTVTLASHLIVESAIVFCNASFTAFAVEDHLNYTVENGALYDKNDMLIAVPPKAQGVFTVPNHVKVIGEYAFAYNDGLTSIDLGSGVERLLGSCFEGCKTLTGTFIIPSNVKFVTRGAFSWCNGATTLDIQACDCSIDAEVFGDASFTELVVSGSHITTTTRSFAYLRKLRKVHLSGNVITLGMTVFRYWDLPEQTMDVIVDGNDIIFGEIAVDKCNIDRFVLTGSRNRLAAGVFRECHINRMELSGSALEISGNPIDDETQVVSVFLNSPEFAVVGALAFSSVKYSGTARFAEGITKIGNSAFAVPASSRSTSSLGTSGLSGYLLFPASLIVVDSGAFANCIGITELGFNAETVNLGSSSFAHCQGLTEVWFHADQSSVTGVTESFVGINPTIHYGSDPPPPPTPESPTAEPVSPDVSEVTKMPLSGETERESETSASSSDAPTEKSDKALKIGLGVGLSALVIIVVVVVVVVVCVRKRRSDYDTTDVLKEQNLYTQQ